MSKHFNYLFMALAATMVADSAMALQPYVAPVWLPGGNLQTLYTAAFLHGPHVTYRRERWEWPDGDFIDADWVDAEPTNAPIVVLFHGLEGSSQSFYARDLMGAVKKKGWRGVVPHFRGCSGEPNRLPRAYFAGDVNDIEAMLKHVKDQYPNAPIYAVGVSLGGNALLKWLGDAGGHAATLVKAAVAVSAPLDMNAAGHALDRGFNRATYTARFLITLKNKALEKARRFPGVLDAQAIAAATTFKQFDTVVTAPLHGYKDAEDYWTRTSSKSGLKNIVVPTLVINAKNDPFLPASALPGPQDVSEHVTLEQPDEGGHVAFPNGPFPGNIDWLPERVVAFMTSIP
ncbi:MAG: YheT family hydrolase [Thiobacillaceae bacterium]